MKIKTQFINSMVIFGIILLIIATSVIVTNQQVERLNTQEEIAKDIERGASELGYLSNDYLLYHESPQRARWESKFSELSNELSKLNPNSPEQQTLVNNIRENQQRLKAVFTDVVSTFENTSQGAVADPALFQISWSRMAVQNQGMMFDAVRLSQMLHDQAEQVKQTNITLIFVLLGIFGAYFLTNYLIVYRHALKSISDLQAGATIIGSGNLDFSIKTNRQDEIGDLSRAFNQMTANLKDVTASKMDLEREITERKRAEEALRESEQRWATTLASIGDAVIASDIEGRVTFMNAVAEELTGWTLADAFIKPVIEVFNIINEYSRAEVDNPVTKVLEEGTIVGLANHTILVRKDRTEVPIDDSGAPIRDGDGKTIGVVLVFRDITERKRAEESLRESEERYRALFDNLNAAALLIEPIFDGGGRLADLHYLMANPSVKKHLNKEPDEFIGRLYSEVFRYPGRNPVFDTYERVLLTGEPFKGEILLPALQRYYDLSVYRPAPGRLALIMSDITERKKAEQAVKESEEKFRSVLDNSRDVIVRFNVQTSRYEYVSPACQALVGYNPEEFSGMDAKTALEMVHPDDLIRLQSAQALSMETGLAEAEYRQRHKNGTWVWVSNRMSVVKDSSGRALFRDSNIRDITERKMAEEMLRKAHDELEIRVQERTADLDEANVELEEKIEEQKHAEEQIRKQAELLDKAQDAIALRDLNHRFIYWNKGSERLYGWKEEEIIGKNADELLYEEESPNLIEAKKRVIEEGEWKGELEQITKDGKEIIVESHWTLMRDNRGKPESILIINTDITEKKRIESHLLRAQRLESIGTLAGGIAHDLNNVLTPIMLSLQMLKGKIKDEQSQKLFATLEQSSQRGASLIKQVLTFARGVEGERNPVQIKHIISEIEKIAKETFPRNIETRTNIPKDLFTISGDATQLHQVIMNLCVNARDAMPQGGTLSISAENFFIDDNYTKINVEAKAGSYILVAVSDTGTGIPPSILDRIFDPFFTTKEQGKGTGLGLSTSLAIVKSHGGFINVYSEVGKGAVFKVYLPAIKSEVLEAEAQQFELPSGKGEYILVAEDEASIREITVSILEAYGYKVLSAADGAEAVALYAQNKDKIKVVLMDMMMPVMDGQTSIQAIRRINPEVKVISVSGLAEKDKLEKIANIQVQAFLPKPYTTERLLKTIHEVNSVK